MKKITKLMIIAAAFILIFTGCSGTKDTKEIESVTREETAPADSSKVETSEEKEAPAGDASDSEVNLADINKEIIETLGVKDELQLNENSAKALYGIEAADMKQCVGFSVMSGTFPHEVVMIEAKDDAAAKRIEEAFNSKIEAFTQQSKNYDAANYALAQKCEVQKNGNFYAMFLSPDFEAIKAVYDKYIN